jgi:Collagen triple helix repeat (20 copies)
MISRIVDSIRHNVVAWLALFVAMGGTSLAASHYIITSTNQIKPSVLKKLHGANGRAGAKGASGAAGAAGAQGPEGKQGAKGENGTNGEPGKEGADLKWAGEYNASVSYKPKEVVYSAGSSWLARKETKGVTPSTGESWELLAKEGKEGKEGKQGVKGEEGKTGAKGEPGSSGVLGYAYVDEKGDLEHKSESFDSAKVEVEPEKEEGVYCISGLTGAAATPHNVEITVSADEYLEGEPKGEQAGPTDARATLGAGDFTSCPAGTQITVETFDPTPKGKQKEFADMGFYIEIN